MPSIRLGKGTEMFMMPPGCCILTSPIHLPVITVSSKSAGKDPDHAYADGVRAISGLSYIVVQLYGQYSLAGSKNRFEAGKSPRNATLAVEHLSRDAFLRRLVSRPTEAPGTVLGHIRHSVEDLNAYIAVTAEEIWPRGQGESHGSTEEENPLKQTSCG